MKLTEQEVRNWQEIFEKRGSFKHEDACLFGMDNCADWLELKARATAAEEALALVENIDPALYDNVIRTVESEAEARGDTQVHAVLDEMTRRKERNDAEQSGR